jgi:hypothetical protein
MIRGHMATYPARRKVVARTLATIAPQVERLSLVLNQYDSVPDELRVFENVEFIIPPQDLRDTGKFWPKAEPDDQVFLLDDDLNYAPHYVSHTLKAVQACLIQRAVYGYHGSCLVPGFETKGFERVVHIMNRRLPSDVIVDMLGTGTTFLQGRHLPPFDFMADSQRFTDIRFARWCQQQGLPRICLNRRPKIITEFEVDESIYTGFTQKLPPEVFAEVKTFGRKTPGSGKSVKRIVAKREKAKAAKDAAKPQT